MNKNRMDNFSRCPDLHRTARDTERQYHLKYGMHVHDTDNRASASRTGRTTHSRAASMISGCLSTISGKNEFRKLISGSEAYELRDGNWFRASQTYYTSWIFSILDDAISENVFWQWTFCLAFRLTSAAPRIIDRTWGTNTGNSASCRRGIFVFDKFQIKILTPIPSQRSVECQAKVVQLPHQCYNVNCIS